MTSDLLQKLQEPFEPDEVKWKPQVVSGARAMAIAYVDARVVMDRLDDVFGVDGWQDDYEQLADGSTVCRLRVKAAGGEWVQKTDIGGQSEQPDEGDRDKSSFSDALKRAAVKLGIGRYLYRLPHQWVDYDVQKRKFVATPQLPAWARPKQAQKPAEKPANGNGHTHVAADSEAVKLWTEWLGREPVLVALNDGLKEVAELEQADKVKVWPLVKSYATRKGWVFDDLRKIFMVPAAKV